MCGVGKKSPHTAQINPKALPPFPHTPPSCCLPHTGTVPCRELCPLPLTAQHSHTPPTSPKPHSSSPAPLPTHTELPQTLTPYS